MTQVGGPYSGGTDPMDQIIDNNGRLTTYDLLDGPWDPPGPSSADSCNSAPSIIYISRPSLYSLFSRFWFCVGSCYDQFLVVCVMSETCLVVIVSCVLYLELVVTTSTYDELRDVFEKVDP